MLLQDRVMVVTGGNSGIGEGIVLEAAREGAAVVVDYVSDKDHADELVARIRNDGGRAVAVEADVSRVTDLQKLIDAAVGEFGHLDVWVSNAGIEHGQPLLETTEDAFDQVIGINLRGAVFGAKLAAQQMVKQGSGGVIVNISSFHEDWPMPSDLAYCVSKGGMRMLTRTAGVELGRHGIRMVGIGPGAIVTPINRDTLDDPEELAALESAIPLGYLGKPVEMGRLVCFAASDAGSYITATTLFADGGLMQKPGAE
jgi:glucose 1-dehydrogenase